MRQKQILGSHFANAWECNKANRLIEQRPDPPGALAYDGLRAGRRRPPADAREQAPREDRRSSSARPRRARAGPRPRRPSRPPSAPRWAPSRWPASSTSPGTRRACAATGSRPRWPRSPRWRCATAPAATRSTATATTATSSCRWPSSSPRTAGSATGTGPSSSDFRVAVPRAGTRCRSSTAGRTSSRLRRARARARRRPPRGGSVHVRSRKRHLSSPSTVGVA